MGLFDWFKKAADGDAVLDAIAAAHGLTPGPLAATGLAPEHAPRARVGTVYGQPVEVARPGPQVLVYVGRLDEEVDIHLGRRDPVVDPVDANLARIAGKDGAALAEAFEFLSNPPGEFDAPRLRTRAVREALLSLPSEVVSLGIHAAGAEFALPAEHASPSIVGAVLNGAARLLDAVRRA